MNAPKHRIYTNDLERERLRQQAYAMTPNRLSLNRHRINRAKDRQLTVIAIVAHERGDQTTYSDARDALGLAPGTRLDTTYEVIESRRETRAFRFGFASNRMITQEILPEIVFDSFPLVAPQAKRAAEFDRVV